MPPDIVRANAIDKIVSGIICARTPKPDKTGLLRFTVKLTEDEYLDIHAVNIRTAVLARAVLQHMTDEEVFSAWAARLNGPRLSEKWRDGVE